MEKEPTHAPDKEALVENFSNLNNITENPDSDGVGDTRPEQRNELALSEFELNAGLGLNPFERPTRVEEATTDHPHYLNASDEEQGGNTVD